jgi:isoleucyl-tRNA synthetase
VELDTVITQALKEEGIVRDIIRDAQDKRKELGLTPGNKADMEITVPQELKLVIEKNKELLVKEIRVNELVVVLDNGAKSYTINIRPIV